MEIINLMGVSIKISAPKTIIEAIEKSNQNQPITIATLNPEFILEAQSNPSFNQTLSKFTFHTIDGAGLFFALKITQITKKQKIQIGMLRGSDLVALLFEKYQKGEKTFYLIGGPNDLAKKAKINIEKKYPKIKIIGAESGGVIDYNNPKPLERSISNINATKPDILLVGMGVVKQEKWIQELLKTVSVPISIGVGGTLEFYVNKPRAPKIIRQLNLEWLFRTIIEKGHYKRAIRSTIIFPLKVLLSVKNLRSNSSK